jgi:monoamine oxidase
MSKPISRATFLKGIAGLSAGVLTAKFCLDNFLTKNQEFPCRILGPSMTTGHMIRNRLLPQKSTKTTNTTVAIIGGGIAGLSSAWWLKKQGFSNFVLLELEPEVGGNSCYGKNQISSYPWGAHYIPIPNKESQYVRILFEELGIIESYKNNLPVYNELYLCHEPQERLFKDGAFHEGLVPKRGLQETDKEQLAAFFNMMEEFRGKVGSDDKPAFAIPLNLSSSNSEFTNLDKISMLEWMQSKNFNSKPLLWYVNYCCRDDYGALAQNVSAWAGIHYFAGRKGTGANAEQNAVLTWPNGNGFIVQQLKDRLKDHIVTNCAASNIKTDGAKLSVTYTDTKTKACLNLVSKYVIFAAPRFLAKYICQNSVLDPQSKALSQDLIYAPWMVANITLKHLPVRDGEQPAWDNVSYYSPSLGYVVNTHQNLSTRQKGTVITYYYPMSSKNPLSARKELAKASCRQWSELIVDDLEKIHPQIKDSILAIDLWPWGHGMISPGVGFIWGNTRKKMQDNVGNLYFAHSDMSGISNFEEAQYHGVRAAQKIIDKICHG